MVPLGAPLLWAVLLLGGPAAQSAPQPQRVAFALRRVTVHMPSSNAQFPAGAAQTLASSQCVICHSADMVLLQPRLRQAQWRTIIGKMRSVYGAPLPAADVDALAAYLAQVLPEATH